MKPAKTILEEYKKSVGANDPKEVDTKSSDRIISLLSTYYRTDKCDSIIWESFGSFVQGLYHVYEDNGHRCRCNIDTERNKAFVNPPRDNLDIKKMSAAHLVKLARVERFKTRPFHCSQGMFSNVKPNLWLGQKYTIVSIHSTPCHSCGRLNQALLYDKTYKVKVGNLYIVPRTVGEGSIIFSLTDAIKNSTVSRF